MILVAKHEVDIPSIDEGKLYSKEVHELVTDLFENNHVSLLGSNLSNPQQYYCNFFSMMDYSSEKEDRLFYPIFDEDLDRFTARVRFDAKRWIEEFNCNEHITSKKND